VSPKTYLHRALNLLYPIECPVDTRIPPDNNEAVNQTEPIGNSRSDTNVGTLRSVSDEDSNILSGDERYIGDEKDIVHASSQDVEIRTRPVRQATLEAKKRLKEWLDPTSNFICVGSVAIPRIT